MEQIKMYLRQLKEHKKLFQITAMVAIVIIAVFVFGQYGEKDEFSEQFAAGGEAQANQADLTEENVEGEAGGGNQKAALEAAQIYVDIGGEVKNPGVYAVAEGTRLFEVIEKAGGLTARASTAQINQAEVVADGQKVVIPTIGEEELWGTSPAETAAAPAGKDSQGRININTADSSTLQEIPGVGPATAEKIIAYREENGKFSKIEDIQNVSGIGNKTFEKMKDKITV